MGVLSGQKLPTDSIKVPLTPNFSFYFQKEYRKKKKTFRGWGHFNPLTSVPALTGRDERWLRVLQGEKIFPMVSR